MKNMIVFVLILLAFSLVACGGDEVPTEEVPSEVVPTVAPPTDNPQQEVPTLPPPVESSPDSTSTELKSDQDGSETDAIDELSPAEIQLDLQGLAQSYDWQVVDAMPIPPGPGGQGFPRHLVMGFDGQNPLDIPYTERRIMYIFPVAEYIDLYSGQGNERVAQQVARLGELIATADGRQGDPEGWMPLLPPPSALMDRWVQFLDLDFNSGRGVRYISDSPFRQSIGVWANDTLDYYYQGLTTDGRYYVSLKWPVSTESLPNTAAEAPEDSVTRAQDPNTYPTYVQETKDVLNALPSSAFNPDLVRLDVMVQSLTLPEPAPSPEDEEEIALPMPDTGDATGTVIASDGIFLRLGPGTDYPYIGAAPFGATGEIIGRSQDSQWWVVNAANVPEAPNGQVWVSAAFVEVTHADNVPIVPAPPLPSSLTGVTWQWISFADPAGETSITDPSRYTITFSEAVDATGPAAIKADCNNVSATYTVDGSSISIVAGASTMAACPEDSLDQQFLVNLGQSIIYFFEEGDLFLALNADAGTMHLSASGSPEAPPEAGDDIIFQLISYGPVGAEQALLESTQITALFSETEVSGSAGCNNYTGTRTWVGDYFTIGPIAVTRQFCSEPAGIMEQEQAYLTALEGVGGYRWVSEVVGGTTIVTAGQLFYTLPDGTTGVMNLITQ